MRALAARACKPPAYPAAPGVADSGVAAPVSPANGDAGGIALGGVTGDAPAIGFYDGDDDRSATHLEARGGAWAEDEMIPALNKALDDRRRGFGGRS